MTSAGICDPTKCELIPEKHIPILRQSLRAPQVQQQLRHAEGRLEDQLVALTALQSAVDRRLDDMSRGLEAATHHLGIPAEVLKELESLEAQSAALEGQLGALQRDAGARRDEAQRLEVERERTSTMAELTTLREQLEDCRAATGAGTTCLAIARMPLAPVLHVQITLALWSLRYRERRKFPESLGSRAHVSQLADHLNWCLQRRKLKSCSQNVRRRCVAAMRPSPAWSNSLLTSNPYTLAVPISS